LSFEPYARVREESLVVIEGRPLHLDFEIGRHEYEDLIRPLVETTFESVAKALQDAQIRAPGLDQVLLVGGATRTPLISRMLKERTGHDARQDVHPDLCVALGAGVMASRLGGHEIARVLVDVSPFSFGVSFLGERGGVPYPHCYKAIIPRNTPLPLTRTERFWTSEPGQPAVQIRVYQGEDEDAIRNIPVGDFRVTGLQDSDDLVEVLCRMRLDLNGILEVTAIEKETGKTKQITISNALAEKSAEEIAASRSRLEALFRSPEPELEVTAEAVNEVAREVVAEVVPIGLSPELRREATQLVERARSLFETMHPDDREEAIDRIEEIERALTEKDQEGCQRAIGALRELIFFVGGRE
jgi:molecular chaperone DnaK (HSP70)